MANTKRRCMHCKEYHERETMIRLPVGFFCSHQHAVEYAYSKQQKAKAKRLRNESAEARERIKSRSDWMKDVQVYFNRFIRLRDHGNSCISCGRDSGAKMNAGHYKSVGSCPELRFEELNVHIQCEHCNSYKSGNIEEYRPRLIEKIGLDKVEWLEGSHDPKKYTVQDLKEIKKTYQFKCRELKKTIGTE